MQQVLDVNILTDTATQKRVGWISILPTVLGALVVGYGIGVAEDVGEGPFSSWLTWLLAMVVVYMVSLPVHELVHALFFKVFGPKGTKVKFGYKSGMLYAGCPGVKIAPWQMTVVLLAPFAVLSLVYLVLGLALGMGVTALCLFLLHAAGCAGDFYFTWLLARHPEADLVEDTENGIRLWNSQE